MKAIAGGINSPISFASLVSGTYLPNHGVNDFSHTLSESVPHLLQIPSHTTAFYNTINQPPFKSGRDSEHILATTLSVENTSHEHLETIEPPFITMERGPGGHAPYGEFEGSAWEYFTNRGAISSDAYAQEYAMSVQKDAEWFLSRLDRLKKRNLLDNTLVIYTSDHGELLGEGGLLGHNGPIHRRLVEVPFVFIHPGISNQHISEEIIRQIDLLPTIMSVCDLEVRHANKLAGRDLTKPTEPTLAPSYYAKTALRDTQFPTISVGYESIWDAHGGYVFPNSPISIRTLAWVQKVVRSPTKSFSLANGTKSIRSFLRGIQRQGVPSFQLEDARNHLNSISKNKERKGDSEANDVPRKRLEELGYLS